MPQIEIFSIEEFNANVKNYLIKGITQHVFDFEGYIFHIKLDLHKVASNIKFKNCVFKEMVIMPYIIINVALFDDSIFEKEVNFKDSEFKCSASFENTTFNDKVILDYAKFENKVRFYKAQFKGETCFYNTKFNDLADFWNAQFYKKTIFNKTDFLGTTVFSSTTFKENVLFTYSLISKLAIFRGTNFEKGLDLSLTIISGDMTLFDIKIKDFEAVNDTNDPIVFSNYVTEDGIISRKNKRETFRIIKYRLIQNQNSIDALNFAKLEMNAYKEELKNYTFKSDFPDKFNSKFFYAEIVKPYIRNKQDRFLLWLNAKSNNHNTSWGRGFAFTFLIAIIFSYFSVVATVNYEIGFKYMMDINFTDCIKYFFTALLPTHSINYLENENPTWGFYVLDFFGRIFISYGIYQTIQAFRKYKIK